MKMKMFFIYTLLGSLLTIKAVSQCNCDTIPAGKIVKENLFYAQLLNDSSFEQVMWAQFHTKIKDLRYVGFEILILKNGIPMKVSFWGNGKKLGIKEYEKIEMKKFIFTKLKWKPAYRLMKNGRKRNIDYSQLFLFDDLLKTAAY